MKMGMFYKDAAPDGAEELGKDWRAALFSRHSGAECLGAKQILIGQCDQHAGMVSRVAQLGQGTSRPTPD